MSHRLLSHDGTVRPVSVDEIDSTIKVDATDSDAAVSLVMQASKDVTLLITLPSSADGRAFSIVGHLSANRKNPAPAVWLTGDIFPDQVSLAFQCGVSAVLVSDEMWHTRGEAAWLNAINPAVKLGYRSQVWSTVSDISQLRQ